MRERAVGQGGRLERQCGEFALRQFGDQRGRGQRTGFLVRIDQHIVAKRACLGRRFERLQGGEDDREPALHIGDAGAVQRFVVEPGLILERVIFGEDRVHMPGQDDTPVRAGAHAQHEVPAVIELDFAPIAGNRRHRRGFDQFDLSRQRAESLRQRFGLPGQADKITGPGIDRAPRLDLAQHGRGIERGEQGGFGVCK